MRFQACIFLRDGSMRSEVVRARNTSDALIKLLATKDVAYAPRGYAYPLKLARPYKQHWRQDIHCSTNGEGEDTMLDGEPPTL